MSKVALTSSAGAYDPNSTDAESVAAWDQAVKEAKDAGIMWERPSDDKRSAEEIIKDTPILRDLGNQEDVRDMLEDRVGGDIETDADAAFRAAQVLEHIEKLDENGDRVASDDVGNGEVNGFSSSGDAYHGTEAGRLKDFGEQGFGFLKGELRDVPSASEDPEARKQAEALGIKWERPESDDRSAKDIIDDSPLLKNLGDQSDIKDMLKERVGDYENDADAAYRADQVLRHVERFDEDGKEIAGNDVANGSIDGFSSSNEAYHGTEAGRLQDFGKYGFESLKGKMSNPDTVGEDKQAREAAEKAGIKWELPEDDKRSAQDILDDNPTLKGLGNQSGVKDMLKERVGDYEKDADAAYRAMQVIDRVVMYNDKGEVQSGDDVANHDINGFSSSDEAYHDTEAGRLQDFGKYGFEALPEVSKPEDSAGYKDFLKANPDADDVSKQFAKDASLIKENFDLIRGKTGTGDYLTAEGMQQYKNENPQISDELKQAIDFWSKPGAFDKLEAAQDPLKLKPDGKLGKADIDSWLKTHNPKDATQSIAFISDVANKNAVSDVDTSKLNADVFKNPDKYSAKEKAAVLQDLLTAQQLISDGAAAGMWSDDYGIVSIANDVRSHPDPEKLLADVTDHISMLESDPEVVKFLNENVSKETSKLFDDHPDLKESVEKNYEDFKSGAALDKLWDANTKDGKTDQQTALAQYFSSASLYQEVLGKKDLAEIQKAVDSSDHAQEFKDYYEKSLVSGSRLEELMKDNTFEEATSVYSSEVALYNAALDPDFTGKFDKQLDDNFNRIAQDNVMKDGTFDDLKKAFGIDGSDQLDEEKVKALIDQVVEKNPEFLANPDGTVATSDQILAGIRGNWDILRQGTKSLSELKPTWLSPGTQDMSNKGVLHGISGIMMAGVTIARGAQNGGNLTDRNIVDITTGSVMTTTLITEGGSKYFKNYLKDAGDNLDPRLKVFANDPIKSLKTTVDTLENSAKGLGGMAGIVAGAYGIFDGVQSIRKGDNVGGGISITAGSLGALAGLASAVEGGAGLLGMTALRAAMAPVAGVLGLAAAGVGAIAMFLPSLIEEGKKQTRQDNFGGLLSEYLTKYEVDGIPYGDIYDVPEEDWPDSDSGIAS